MVFLVGSPLLALVVSTPQGGCVVLRCYMVLIANFPQTYLDEHRNWHMNQMNRMPIDKDHPGSPGYGDDFLNFHQGFISDVIWHLTQERGLDPGLFAPWPDIPAELKALSGWGSVQADYD